MTAEEWDKINELFNTALDLAPADREAYLKGACEGDDHLLTEVRSLLVAEDEAGDFIRKPLLPNLHNLSEPEHESALIGKTIGNFLVERSIGSGGMGDVFLAMDLRLGRKVALKMLPNSLASDPTFLKRFENEAKAAATLNHPNVATIYSVEEIDGKQVIAMEYVEGKTLDQLTPSKGLDIATFLDWFTCLSDALKHAHERGVIHRDVKPGNIIVTPNGIPKILDFGLAQFDRTRYLMGSDETSITQPGQIIGTPSYMSPEQAEGKEVDQRTDIFSLGVVMYESLSGERPFTGNSHAEVVSNLLKTDPPPLRTLRPQTPSEITRLVERCLVKSRRRRCRSMDEVNDILSEAWGRISTTGSRNSLRKIYREFNPESNRWAGSIVLVVLIVAVAASYLFSDPQPELPISFENMTPRSLSQSNNVVYAHTAPDGLSYVYNTIEDDGRRAMWLRRLNDRTSLQLLPPASVWFWGGLAITEDASQVFYITAERLARFGTLYRISSLGGTPRKLVEGINDLGSLSPDGKRILYVRYGDRVEILSADITDGSDEQTHFRAEKGAIIRDPQFSNDGMQIYYSKVVNNGGTEAWTLNAVETTGENERIITGPRRGRISEVAVLGKGRGLLVNQVDADSNLNQIYFVSQRDGRETRITNDLNSYFGLSVTADDHSIVTARRQMMNDIWVGTPDDDASFAKITNEPTVNARVEWTPDGRVVYDALENSIPHIWIMNADGTGAEQISPLDSADSEPQVSPSGESVVFVSDRTGERKIWRMDIDGSDPVMLGPTSGSGLQPRFSPDGGNVYFVWMDGAEKKMGMVSIDGGEVRALPPFSDTYWAFSPDGKTLAFSYYDEELKRPKVRIRPVDQPSDGVTLDIAPSHIFQWTRDGKRLIYKEREAGENPFSTILIIDPVSGKKDQYLTTGTDTVFDMAISRDGRQAAVIRGRLMTDAVMLSNNR